MAGDRGDWMLVRLTKHGENFAMGGPIRILDRTEFVFTPGETLEVTKSDWETQLSKFTINGELLVEPAE